MTESLRRIFRRPSGTIRDAALSLPAGKLLGHFSVVPMGRKPKTHARNAAPVPCA